MTEPVAPADVWAAWEAQPGVVAAAAAAAFTYGAGARKRCLPARKVASFGAGMAIAVAVVISPLQALGETLFSAHMLQHLLLVQIAAALLAYGIAPLAYGIAPLAYGIAPLAYGLRMLRNSVTVTSAFAVALWAWHLPALYGLAVEHEFVHAAEHATFLVAATALWALVLSGRPHGVRILCVFATTVHGAALGALLTFASYPLYPVHATGAAVWSLHPLQDQQIAGVLMWIPPGVQYVATMAVLLVAWMRDAAARGALTWGDG